MEIIFLYRNTKFNIIFNNSLNVMVQYLLKQNQTYIKYLKGFNSAYFLWS